MDRRPMTSESYVFSLYSSSNFVRSVFSHPNTQPSNVVVDAMSLGLVNGAMIDFAAELIGSSFRITDNPQASGSGCGCGVSWEAKA